MSSRTSPRSAAPRSPRSRASLALLAAVGAAVVLAVATAACTTGAREAREKPTPDRDMAAVLRELDLLAPRPIETLSPVTARLQPTVLDAAIQVAQRNGDLSPEPAPAVAAVDTRIVPGEGGTPLRARVYTPPGDGPFPVVVYFHGGGFVLGSIDAYDGSSRALCARGGAVVVAVEYRKGPEHKFPAAHEDAYAATQHVIANARGFGGDPARVAVAGEGAGGNLATGVCLLARERGGAVPVHQLLIHPLVAAANDTASHRDHAQQEPLRAAAIVWCYEQYLRSPAERRDRLIAPLAAPLETLRGLPPATVITAAVDPLRSEGQAYAAALAQAGVRVEARDHDGVTHDFFGMGGVVARADDAQRFAGARLREALGGVVGETAAARRANARAAQRREYAEAGASAAGAAAVAVVRGGAASGRRDERLEEVARFPGPAMPTGVAVSRSGRVFVCFPRWGDPVEDTVIELRQGRHVPFPDAATNTFRPDRTGRGDASRVLVNVQSVVVDSADTLWLVDSGSLELGPVIPGAPKLWGYDLATDRLVTRVVFPNDVVRKHTYLNDVRVDRRRGAAGHAFLTDSGAGGIVVVDLASGRSWRQLDGVPAVMPAPALQLTNEGEPFLVRKPNGEQAAPDIRSDGIALSPDGETLYFSPLASRDLFAVPTALLADADAEPGRVAAAVRRIATKPSANDGLECSVADGAIVSTDWEDGALRRIDPATGAVDVLLQDERLIWPDSLAWHGHDLFVMTNQLARQPRHHWGVDLRTPPYVLFRVREAASR
jgi:acetyl esterase